MQLGLPGALNVPGSQEMQALASGASPQDVKVPSGHWAHSAAPPLPVWYVPPGQDPAADMLGSEHHAQPPLDCVFGGQVVHCVEPKVGAK